MVQVKSRYLYLLDLLVCACLLVLGITYYVVAQTLNVYGDLSIKYQAENILYLTIVFVIGVNLYFFFMLRRSKKLLKDLDKVIELTKYGRHDISEFLKRWGELGEKINFLLFQIHQINQMQSLKISSLSGVVDFLFKHTRASLLLADAQGKITVASGQLAVALDTTAEELVGRHVAELAEDINFEGIFLELERSYSPVTKEAVVLTHREKRVQVNLAFCPVLNAANQLSMVIVAAENEHLLLNEPLTAAGGPAADTAETSRASDVHRGLLDFFQKKFKKK
jgi:transcriptional regulator with PAS, ATPase and Fis domain